MNSMERMGALLSGLPIDRKMFCLTLSMYGAKLTGCPLKEYYRNAKAYYEGQKAVVQKIKPDIVFSPFSLPLEANAFGSEIKFFEKNPPNVKKPVIQSLSDIERLRVPDISKSWQHEYFIESIERLAESYKGKIPIAVPVSSPVDLPILLFGIEGWLEVFLFHHEKAMKVIKILTEYFVEWTERIIFAGADFLVIPVMFCNHRIISKNLFSEDLSECYKRAFSRVKGAIVLHHGGAEMLNFLGSFKDMPNAGAFVIDSRDKFSESRKRINPEQLIIGNLDGPSLWRYNSEQMKKICSIKKQQLADDYRSILGTSNADVAYDTPLETLLSIYEYVEENWRFDEQN